jgi:hypothetical protein
MLHSTAKFHRCVPDVVSGAVAASSTIDTNGLWGDLSSDFITTWQDIIYLCIIAAGCIGVHTAPYYLRLLPLTELDFVIFSLVVALALIMLILLRFVAPLLIWVTYWGAIIVCFGLCHAFASFVA